MNGRIYDYRLGRFLGVDPIVQFPTNSQSLNPYTYILNNPFTGTDPTGFAASCKGLSSSDCRFELASGGRSGGSSSYQLGFATTGGNGSSEKAGPIGPGNERAERVGGSSTFGATDQRYALSVHQGGEGGGLGYFVPDIDELREAQQAFEAVRQRIAESQRDWYADRPRRNAEAREIGWRFAGEPIFAALGAKLFQGALGELARLRAATAPASSADAAVGSQSLLAAKTLPHKNSLDYVGDTHVYRVKGPDGTYKIGESAQGVRVSDGASIRAEQQVRQLQRQTGDEFRSDIRKPFPDKASARDYETRLIERFRRMYGADTLPGNKTNR